MNISEKQKGNVNKPKKVKGFVSHFAKQRQMSDYIDAETKNATIPFLFTFYKEIAASRGNITSFIKNGAVSSHGSQSVNKVIGHKIANGEPFNAEMFTSAVKLVREMYKKGFLAVLNYLKRNKVNIDEKSIKEHLKQKLQEDPMMDVPNKGDIEGEAFAESNQVNEVSGTINTPANTGTLFLVNGKSKKVSPKNGTDFDYKELRALINASHVQILSLGKQGWLVIDDDGKNKDKPINIAATLLYANFNPNDYIVGDALLCSKDMIV